MAATHCPTCESGQHNQCWVRWYTEGNGISLCGCQCPPPTRAAAPGREDGPSRMTLTVGDILDYLATLPRTLPVTIAAPENAGTMSDWFNVEGIDPVTAQSVSVILRAADDFDTRQF